MFVFDILHCGICGVLYYGISVSTFTFLHHFTASLFSLAISFWLQACLLNSCSVLLI